VLYRFAGAVCHPLGWVTECGFYYCISDICGDACGHGCIDCVNWSQNANFTDKDLPGGKDSRSHLVFPGDCVVNEKKNTEAGLTAYCGLYCGDCLRYRSKAAGLARDLLGELQAAQFDKYAEVKSASVKELKHYEECHQVLDAIVRLGCDTPCKLGGDGCSGPCEIKNCVQMKKLEGCWECDEFERCDKFESFGRFHGDTAKENLRKIKEYGLSRWAEHRGKFYSWM